MCNFCKIGAVEDVSCYPTYDFYGDDLEFIEDLGAKRQNLQVNILEDEDNDCNSLWITADHLDVKIEIRFCPICGRKL